ncbi:MAG: type I 3-dehydroquinate dehydratase [Verrucomicrobiota bacterium]|nr:type I 3-dehydroquinate dehydratase [Verrucomicrobiota bacterium]
MRPGLTVGVIFSLRDLGRAVRMRRPPDLFELRLDALATALDRVEATIPSLRAPLIVTARDPREGGANVLSLRTRRALLERFLPYAAYVDLELRLTESYHALRLEADRKSVKQILSFHDFRGTPALAVLSGKAEDAIQDEAHIFKVATLVDTQTQLARLITFFDHAAPRIPLAAMGLGPLGRQSRIALVRRGSVLSYAHLGDPQIDGQLSLAEVRAALRRPLRAEL